jgi:ketosteroid isomerase-like protein
MDEPNVALIDRFYGAFARRDGEAMAACYAPGARFDDPAFPGLSGDQPGLMWRMLTSRGGDLEVELLEREAEGDRGSAHWVADYTFTQTGRRVHNDVRATFRFADGLIAEHRDDFGFHAWARQALGAPGLLLGWAPPMRAAVQKKARAQLDAFAAEQRTAS